MNCELSCIWLVESNDIWTYLLGEKVVPIHGFGCRLLKKISARFLVENYQLGSISQAYGNVLHVLRTSRALWGASILRVIILKFQQVTQLCSRPRAQTSKLLHGGRFRSRLPLKNYCLQQKSLCRSTPLWISNLTSRNEESNSLIKMKKIIQMLSLPGQDPTQIFYVNHHSLLLHNRIRGEVFLLGLYNKQVLFVQVAIFGLVCFSVWQWANHYIWFLLHYNCIQGFQNRLFCAKNFPLGLKCYVYSKPLFIASRIASLFQGYIQFQTQQPCNFKIKFEGTTYLLIEWYLIVNEHTQHWQLVEYNRLRSRVRK